MAIKAYYPEMGQKKPETDIEASLSHYGKHYYVKSKEQIPTKQGVEFIRQLKAEDYIDKNNRKIGWYEYKMTVKAFEKLSAQKDIGYEMLLD